MEQIKALKLTAKLTEEEFLKKLGLKGKLERVYWLWEEGKRVVYVDLEGAIPKELP